MNYPSYNDVEVVYKKAYERQQKNLLPTAEEWIDLKVFYKMITGVNLIINNNRSNCVSCSVSTVLKALKDYMDNYQLITLVHASNIKTNDYDNGLDGGNIQTSRDGLSAAITEIAGAPTGNETISKSESRKGKSGKTK